MTIRIGDSRTLARELDPDSVDCIVTSPPYWGLRSYLASDDPDKANEMGAEATLGEYVERLVVLFRELRRALKPEGVAWLNLGDSYARNPAKGGSGTPNGRNVSEMGYDGQKAVPDGLKPKDLCLVPYRVALALQDDGWWLRSHTIWAKPNPMPESVTDRPTSSHEAVFLLTKSESYWYDADAVREPHTSPNVTHRSQRTPAGVSDAYHGNAPTNYGRAGNHPDGRNLRNVWTIPTRPYTGSHYAVMPPALAERCVLSGCPAGGLVLDPFGGSGTVGEAAEKYGRRWLLFDLDARNEALMRQRTAQRGLLGLVR